MNREPVRVRETLGAVFAASEPVRIGGVRRDDPPAAAFEGLIDEVRIARGDRTDSLLAGETAYDYNERNQLVRATSGAAVTGYAYDPNGNQIESATAVGAGGTTLLEQVAMQYDQLNRMVSWAKVGAGGAPVAAESHTYRGAEWHRVATSAGGSVTQFLYDGDNVVADFSGGAMTRSYVTPFLDQNLSMTLPGGPSYYYSQDGLGSVRTLTDPSGVAVNKYDYTAFGETLPATTTLTIGNRYTYTGREASAASGPMYYRYRHYHAGLGRFGARDPIGYRGGVSLYAYSLSNAPNYSDPLGLGEYDAVEETFTTRCNPCEVKDSIKDEIDKVDAMLEYLKGRKKVWTGKARHSNNGGGISACPHCAGSAHACQAFPASATPSVHATLIRLDVSSSVSH